MDENQHSDLSRERSKSLPIGEREKAPPAEPAPKTQTTPPVLQEPITTPVSDTSRHASPEKEFRKDPPFKRIKVSEIKHMIGMHYNSEFRYLRH